MKRLSTWIFGSLAALVMVGTLHSQLRAEDGDEGKDGGNKRQERMMDHMKKALDLSDDQVSKIKDEDKANRDAMKGLREKSTLDFDTLKLLIDKKASDDELKPVIADVKADMKADREQAQKHMEAMAAILSPMQQAKGIMMLRHRAHQMGQGWQHHGDEMGGEDKDN